MFGRFDGRLGRSGSGARTVGRLVGLSVGRRLPRHSQSLPRHFQRLPRQSQSLPRHSHRLHRHSQSLPRHSQSFPKLPRAPQSFPELPRAKPTSEINAIELISPLICDGQKLLQEFANQRTHSLRMPNMPQKLALASVRILLPVRLAP